MANLIVKGGTIDEYSQELNKNEQGKLIYVTDTALCDDGIVLIDKCDPNSVKYTVIPMDILSEVFRRIVHSVSSLPEEDG